MKPNGPKKPSAASRTVDMFAQPPPIDDRPIEVEEKAPEHAGERVPLEQDVDRMRDQAFLVQQWTTSAFGAPENQAVKSEEFRITKRDGFYFVETLRSEPGKPAYGYSGVMVREENLYSLTACLVQAVRAKQSDDAKKRGDTK
jgi:hypothetical protein